ncbi:MAG TPA: SLATT domain-containing protein [Candidatus Desulfaltia sp.]|nr:SLATT domain-containing protein [Candidatus Desulfaltia sp.]
MTGQTAIPARIVIGVTGHRRLENEAFLASEVAGVLEKIKNLLPPLKRTPVAFTVLSPLAEGADRLMAQVILGTTGAQLDVILPMGKEDYAADFTLPDSQAEFEELFAKSRKSRQLSPSPSRTEAYARAGRYTVDHCDVLIAIWDGEAGNGQGGTWEVVSYARTKQCPLFWIRADGRAETTFEPGRGINVRTFEDLDAFNSERVDKRRVGEKLRERCADLQKKARDTGFPLGRVHDTCSDVLSHYFRTDILALRYQHIHYKAGSFVYALATGAVATAAFQALFFPGWSHLALVEVVLIGAVLAIVWLGHRRSWHAKWIDYRFLAERFRSAFFLALSRVEVTAPRPPRHLSLAYSSKDWMITAFMSFWRGLPRLKPFGRADFARLRSFILDAWIEDQIRYHQGTAGRHRRRHRRLARIGNVLFGLTFAAAFLHFIGLGGEFLGRLLLFLAIVSPAVAASLGAVRTHREYLRNAQRSQEMARHLQELKARMKEAQDLESFLPLVQEAEEVMLQENADWRVVVRFHELEPPA